MVSHLLNIYNVVFAGNRKMSGQLIQRSQRKEKENKWKRTNNTILIFQVDSKKGRFQCCVGWNSCFKLWGRVILEVPDSDQNNRATCRLANWVGWPESKKRNSLGFLHNSYSFIPLFPPQLLSPRNGPDPQHAIPPSLKPNLLYIYIVLKWKHEQPSYLENKYVPYFAGFCILSLTAVYKSKSE